MYQMTSYTLMYPLVNL